MEVALADVEVANVVGLVVVFAAAMELLDLLVVWIKTASTFLVEEGLTTATDELELELTAGATWLVDEVVGTMTTLETLVVDGAATTLVEEVSSLCPCRVKVPATHGAPVSYEPSDPLVTVMISETTS